MNSMMLKNSSIPVTCSLSGTEVMQRIHQGAVIIDVMTPEDFAACHVAGAVNACIYEMVFLDRISNLAIARDSELIIYDTTGTTRTAEQACDRLREAGFEQVAIMKGGLNAWREAHLPIDSDEQFGGMVLVQRDGRYRIDAEKSRLEWVGRNLNKRHYGSIPVQSGELTMDGDRLSAGTITLDMTAISNWDLQDTAWRDMLIRHLKSADFFAVDSFPTASFIVTGWETKEVDSQSAVKGTVRGELTIKNVTRPISISATIAPQQDGSIQAHAVFDLDRTLWDVSYGSSRLFERLGMHYVHDLISLELFVTAT